MRWILYGAGVFMLAVAFGMAFNNSALALGIIGAGLVVASLGVA